MAAVGLLLSLWMPLSGGESLALEPWSVPVPPFHLQDTQGVFHHLQDYRGQVVVVNFWASWCTPCRRELPSMNRAWAELGPRGIVMLAINLGEELEAVNGFMQDFPIDFPVLLDRRGNLARNSQVRGLPTTYVIDGRGEIVYRAVGERIWDDPLVLRQVMALRPPGANTEPRMVAEPEQGDNRSPSDRDNHEAY